MEGLKIKCETVEQRKQAQELLFSLGYGWNCGGTKEVRYLNMPYLYAYPRSKDMTFGRIESHSSFIKNRNKEITLQELRAMVNQEKDEPFLTPETTLNDQYAEIERARQSAYDKQEGGSHYKKLAIQPMQYALANKLDYAQANVVKYVTRHADKNGKEDLLKAIHNIELMIEHYYGVEK